MQSVEVAIHKKKNYLYNKKNKCQHIKELSDLFEIENKILTRHNCCDQKTVWL